MSEEAALESALGSAFGSAPPPKTSAPEPAPVETPEPVAAAEEVEADPAAEQELAPEEPETTEAVAEPEFEIEVEGAREVIRGNDKVKELLQKGLHYSKNSEAVAREREAIIAAGKYQQQVNTLHNALSQDMTQLQALNQQCEQWERVDLASLFETDPFKALQLKEQRDQLREARAAKFNEVQQKGSQVVQALQAADSQRLIAEEQALVAKLPEWRNSERAQAEVGKIKSWLTNQGYTPAEAAQIGDHRHMLVARKAYLYDQLMANKDAKIKQVREAPQTVKPGAAQAASNGRTDFNKAKAKLREFGSKGNHRAQENLATQMFERAFK